MARAGERKNGLKVLYISNALTHYYNLVLSRLNTVPGVEIVAVAPRETSKNVGQGVHQTKEGITFKVFELEEYTRFGIYSTFRELEKILAKEKPDIVIVSEAHLLTFLLNIRTVLVMKRLGAKLIMQSIPFRLPKFEEVKNRIHERSVVFQKFPRWFGTLLYKSGVERLIRLAHVYFMKYAYNLPDAHINYIEDAYEIFGSYGVGKDKIFITYNSPDTDRLFEIRESLTGTAPIMTKNDHRLIHVGRLVEWKRVDLLIRAFARIKKVYNHAELLIVGYGPMEEELKRLTDHLQVGADVKFVGGVYDPRVLGQYLMASSVYVLAGMGGLSINDAMCFGLPVICSVGDGTEKKLVRDEFNGKYFKEGDEDDLVEKISYLFAHPQLLKRMGNNSTAIIKNEINIHTVIKGFTDAFEFVLKDRREPWRRG
jgi:glycosyltransferase involved in cell wall biosynthesis